MTNKYLEKIAAARHVGQGHLAGHGDFVDPISHGHTVRDNILHSEAGKKLKENLHRAQADLDFKQDKAWKELSVGPNNVDKEWHEKKRFHGGISGGLYNSHFDGDNLRRSRRIGEALHVEHRALHEAESAARRHGYKADSDGLHAESRRSKRINIAQDLTKRKVFGKQLRTAGIVAGGVAAGVGALIASRKKKD